MFEMADSSPARACLLAPEADDVSSNYDSRDIAFEPLAENIEHFLLHAVVVQEPCQEGVSNEPKLLQVGPPTPPAEPSFNDLFISAKMEQVDARGPPKNPYEFDTPTPSRRSSLHISRKTSWGTPIPGPSNHRKQASKEEETEEVFDEVDLASNGGASLTSEGNPGWNTVENITALGLSLAPDEESADSPPAKERFSVDEDDAETLEKDATKHKHNPLPFHKWVKLLQKRASGKQKNSDPLHPDIWSGNYDGARDGNSSHHKKSSSGSSMGFVTAVKSASFSLATMSIAPKSKRTGAAKSHFRNDRSSKNSTTGPRVSVSEDEASERIHAIDQATAARSFKRRHVLEEIISSEESYVADIKFLTNIYVTLLASIPTLSLNLRSSINRNLTDIVELHEELLGDLHRAVPHSEYTQADFIKPKPQPTENGHHRWRSLDAVPEHTGNLTWLQKEPGVTAEPCVAAEVARIFERKMYRFFAYEEYGAKYETMVNDVASTHRTLPQWDVYQKGLENLAAALSSINSQQSGSRKSLTVGDLLVKPIQRICRYPLLFSELLKQTPVCDCPDSHMQIEKVLIRLRETTAEINNARADPRMKTLMEKTWLLQDRLSFADQPDSGSTNAVRTLGHIHLCGVLYVAWQTKPLRDVVDGQYMVCLLYKEFLLLASAASKTSQTYNIQASIGLREIRIEDVDNGRGLQCHTAPYSWKLVFESDYQLYEIIMCACSPKEELEWRSRLSSLASKDNMDTFEQAPLTSLSLPIKPLGTVFGKPGTVARRLSIHRATTVGPKSALCQVIIKNTSMVPHKDASSSTSSANIIARSQSLLQTNRIPVLAPTRTERVKLEILLQDVWTREVLPYPGMTGRVGSGHGLRASAASASHMMRKLSVASITSGFSKRSESFSSNRREPEPGADDDLHAVWADVAEAATGSNSIVDCAVDEDDAPHDDEKVPHGIPLPPLTTTIQIPITEIDSSDDDKFAADGLARFNTQSPGNTRRSNLLVSAPSPNGSLQRLMSLRKKQSWRHASAPDRVVRERASEMSMRVESHTPPLRAGSANSNETTQMRKKMMNAGKKTRTSSTHSAPLLLRNLSKENVGAQVMFEPAEGRANEKARSAGTGKRERRKTGLFEGIEGIKSFFR